MLDMLILILTSTIGIAAKPTPTPDPAEQVQDNNSEQQGLIDGIISDINIIKNQILQLENFIQILGNLVKIKWTELASEDLNAIHKYDSDKYI